VCWSSEIRVNICRRTLRDISTRIAGKDGTQEVRSGVSWALFRGDRYQLSENVWSARTRSARHPRCDVSRRACQGDDRQVMSLRVESDGGLEPLFWLARDESPWLGTRRAARPAWARFDSWFSVGGEPTFVLFHGRLATKRDIRAMLMMTVDDREQLSSERFPAKRSGAST